MLQGALAVTAVTAGAASPATPASAVEASMRRARGMAVLERVTGDSGRAVIDGLGGIAPELGGFIVDFCYGEVIGRPGLDLKTRQLATVAALAALGHAGPRLKVHVRGALNVGATRAEVVEILLQTAVYAGFPAALNAVASAREAFAEAGG
ncbi:carboxymuconolactone decarboxylase family protein [Xanthomonas theicola]|uniref:Carboxymuconolactone decarboxylase n=1 Tax=Xanthomonas theicola TaxID=56464 RepID=A0A2S6ZM18_9XANT|nr:carboxymuconolactone decarboxylase family protein [Xanthomonas theicola]PPT93311.1 carboxymuconolactone decarboxylase [Xanthomonas theicola]QNH24536.1 carboxymuconolactone decarboxylase family protein [Xanthomonas theicola]